MWTVSTINRIKWLV